MRSDFSDELYFSAAFPLPFRVLALAALGVLGWATNLHGLHVWGVDAAGVLDLNSNNYDGGHRLTSTSPLPTSVSADRRTGGWRHQHQHQQTYVPVYRAFAAFGGWVFVCWAVFRYAAGTGADAADGDGGAGVGAVDGYKFVPAVAALGALTVLVCPFQVAYKPQRDKFLA